MDFMAWVNVLMAIVGLTVVGLGVRILAGGTVPRWVTPVDEPGRVGRYALCFGAFFLLQVVGYLGVEAGLFNSVVRGLLVLLGFAVGVFALVKYRPRVSKG
jgi:hypothetical protein